MDGTAATESVTDVGGWLEVGQRTEQSNTGSAVLDCRAIDTGQAACIFGTDGGSRFLMNVATTIRVHGVKALNAIA